MTTNKDPLSGALVVSSKVLGHISQGLYRSPGGVFKELISNSFDANATTVWISTGRPSFDVLSIRDNGDGMDRQKFIEVVQGGIGDSDKRVATPKLMNERRMIGRLGIGILGISQISHTFEIVSHHAATETAFRAIVRMTDFRTSILDKEPTGTSFEVGNYEVEDIAYESDRHGVTVTATEPTEGFLRQLAGDNPAALPKDFKTFVLETQIKDYLATTDTYRKMVWEIASLAPIPYFKGGPIGDHKAAEALVERLNNYDFNIVLDGIRLLRPVLLSEGAAGDGSIIFPLSFDELIWGEQLKVMGYLYATDGNQIHPDDVRGVLIRVKEVGIDAYDKSLMGYRYAEGPRFGWLSGEVYVEAGMEDALTIGRDGFDVGHPHYVALRTWLHKKLRSIVFPALYKGIITRRDIRDEERTSQRQAAFIESISEYIGKDLRIAWQAIPGGPPAKFDLDNGLVTLNTVAKWPRGRRRRERAERFSIIFEIILSVDNHDEGPSEDFLELCKELIANS